MTLALAVLELAESDWPVWNRGSLSLHRLAEKMAVQVGPELVWPEQVWLEPVVQAWLEPVCLVRDVFVLAFFLLAEPAQIEPEPDAPALVSLEPVLPELAWLELVLPQPVDRQHDYISDTGFSCQPALLETEARCYIYYR